MTHSVKVFSFFAILFFLSFFTKEVVFASETESTITGYAWSENIGWINFGAFSEAKITDNVLSGYIWSENKGRIKLNPSTSGVQNNSEGVLSGYAWGEGTGWINFSGVTVDSSGKFAGTATGDITGTINFNCNNCSVSTDWRKASLRVGSGGFVVLSSPNLPLSFLINNGLEYTNNQLVVLKFQAGSDVKKISISNSPEFKDAIQEEYKETKLWNLLSENGEKIVYVRFYTQHGQPSPIIESSIILDTKPPEIVIEIFKEKYQVDQEIIIGGKTESNAEIISIIDDNDYGFFTANEQGEWLVTFGKMELGFHKIEFYAKDLAGNYGENFLVNFSVESAGATLIPALGPILRQLEKGIAPLIPKIFKKEEIKPVEVIKISKTAPISLSGKWNTLPMKSLSAFVLAPLPKDIAILGQKFSNIEKTFQEVDIAKITDVQKLRTASLKLPNLTEVAQIADAELKTEKLELIKGIPIHKFTTLAKNNIPSNIVFTKAGGGLIDFDIALSINEKGNSQQKITTIAGKTMQFVVKVDEPVKKVTGYIVFKSKKINKTSFDISLDYMTASLTFAEPVFIREQEKAVEKIYEERLVILEFEYQDTGQGVYVADVEMPVVDGEYEIITVMNYDGENVIQKEIKLITVVDPEGYIYEKNGDMETRIIGAIVSLYWLNPETKQYELWPAKEYQQENPQITDVRGTYSFLVPNGHYYLKVDAPGYENYDGKSFEVKEGSGVHINIKLNSKYWWLKVVDWKTGLLILVVLMLLYNFYKDRVRAKITHNQ